MPVRDDSGLPAQPTGAPPEENRSSRRAPIKLRVDYEQMNTFFADYTKNISKGGSFIRTSRPLPIGTRFVFMLSVPALPDPVALQGEVAWTRSPDEAGEHSEEAGMGIRFVFEQDAQRQAFEDLVEKLMVESLGLEVAHRLLRG